MKKLFTLALLLLGLNICSADAQDRKTWDFTKGFSAVTIANLEADNANWTPSVNGSKKWAESKARSSANTELTATVNGQSWTLPETAGLLFGAKSAKHINVVYAEGSDDTHIWLNGAKGEDYIIIPGVPAGETITVTFSSHGGKDDRGFTVSTANVTDENGQSTFLSAGQSTVVLINNNAEATDVKLAAKTGGMHFYKIVIGEGDAEKNINIAYLYNGNENDEVLTYLKGREATTVTPINVNTTSVSATDLQAYDVTVVGASIPADNAIVSVLKEALPWTPVLNMNGTLYNTWGYGETSETSSVIVVANAKSSLFTDITFNDAMGFNAVVLNEDIATMTSVKLGEYFADDEVVANPLNDEGDGGDENFAAIHTHNITHNGYIYVPFVQNYTADAYLLLSNAINMLQNSKAEITAAAAPSISRVYKNLMTQVTIKAPNLPKARVFYTIDGSEPTVESTEYTEPLELTTACTLKAVAIAEGYTLSNVASLDVQIKEQPAAPSISYNMNEGNTKLTFACTTPETTIWYNFIGAVDTLKSTKYVDTVNVVITMPQDVTAFSTIGETTEAVFSEATTQRVLVKSPRVVIDVAAHFSAPQWTADNNPTGLAVANGKGMFSWGASAATMYTGEGVLGTDPETGDEIIIYSDEDLRPYEIVNEAGENPEWMLKSRGTCLIWQNTGAQTTNFGDNSNYNPMYSTDVDPLFPVTKNDIQFYKFFEGQPANASIETINKYQAPLDIVVLANMQGGPLLAQVSTDGENWETVGEIEKTGYSRMWGKSTLSYNGTDEVFVRITEEALSSGPKVFDIYIANQGDKSKELLQDLENELTGINEISAQPSTAAPAGIYRLNGVRLNSLQRGLNIVIGQDGQVRKVMMK